MSSAGVTIERPEVSVRRATIDDAASLRAWRNDASVRRASRRSPVVTAPEHLAWPTAVRSDPNRHRLIAEADGAPVGQVRFDRIDRSTFEISVSVEVRGRGLGSAAIMVGIQWLAATEGSTLVEAQVRSDNAASLRAFESTGFRDVSPTEAEFRCLTLCGDAADS